MVVLSMSKFVLTFLGMFLFCTIASYCTLYGKRGSGLYIDFAVFSILLAISIKFSEVV